MAIQDFTAGQVLTAAQMDALQANDYNQTVSTKTASYTLVAADKGTRIAMNSASATTITVNTSLFAAGDTLYLQNINTGTCTVTAGTATVTSAGSLAIPQWGSGLLYFTSASAAIYFPSATVTTNPGLVYITGATFTTAATVSMAAGVFTSTYENYLVMLNLTASSANQNVLIRVNNVGTPRTAANYYGGKVHRVTSTVTSGGTSHNFAADNATYPAVAHSIYVTQPTNAAVKTNWFSTGIGYPDGGGSGTDISTSACNYDVAEANDGLTFFVTGTITGFYKVYGIVNS